MNEDTKTLNCVANSNTSCMAVLCFIGGMALVAYAIHEGRTIKIVALGCELVIQ